MLKKITLSLAVFFLSTLSFADEWYVRSLDDSGAGTLREQITNASSQPGPDTVIVDVKGDILLANPITITDSDGLVIIGATAKHTTIAPIDGGFSGAELIDIDGSSSVALEAIRFESAPGTTTRFITIREYLGKLRIERCVFEGNVTSGQGGAILILNPGGGSPPPVDVVACSFIDNQAEYGGAIAIAGGDAEITNNTFYLNRAVQTSSGGRGGAIYIQGIFSSGIDLNHNTFVENSVAGPGAAGEAVYTSVTSSVKITNNASADNGTTEQFSGLLYLTGGGNRILANYGSEPGPWTIGATGDLISSTLIVGFRDTLKEDGYGLKYLPIVDDASGLIDVGSVIISKQTDCRRAPRVLDAMSDGSDFPDAGACEYSEFRVTTYSAGGANSLAWAIAAFKSDPTCYIEFDLPLPMGSIVLTADVLVNQRTYLDGFSQPGSSVPGPVTPSANDELTPAQDIPVIDGGGIVDNGLIVGTASAGSTIAGLRLINAGANGLAIKSNSNHIFGNCIGLTQDGAAAPNAEKGIEVTANSTIIGGKWHHERNVVSGNGGATGAGLTICNIAVASGWLNNKIYGNIIGVQGDAKTLLSPSQEEDGIVISGELTKVGDSKWGHRNYIGGNTIGVKMVNGKGTLISNNYIGVGYDGEDLISNDKGIEAESSGFGEDLDIGKFGENGGNVISGNSTTGIRLLSYEGVYLVNNYIGTNAAGTASAGIQPSGILVDAPTVNLTIGDVDPSGDVSINLISGNGDGIGMNQVGPGCTIRNNFIGTDVTGNLPIPNTSHGIIIGGTANGVTIGSSTAGNLISGNTNGGGDACGIKVVNTNNHTIYNNIIGVRGDNTAELANNIGIELNNSSGTSIGGSTALNSGNVISGNTLYGIYAHSGGSGVDIFRNLIGTDTTGMNEMGNDNTGIYIDGVSNSIIGDNADNGNVISGSSVAGSASGIWLSGTATGTSIQANKIGLNILGNTAIPNDNGILLEDAHQATIGGAFATNRHNIIAGNEGSGIRNESSNSVIVDGNYIGVDISQAAMANQNGVHNFSSGMTIGGTNGNVISANDENGIYFEGVDANESEVYNNMIGTDLSGTNNLGNSGNGILIEGGSDNEIGVTDTNVIVYNGEDGIRLNTNADSNNVTRNEIGCNGSVSMPNGQSGIHILNNSIGNTIGGDWNTERNNISGNTNHGILIESGSSSNKILGNSIGNDGIIGFGNEQSGIYIDVNSNNTQIGESIGTDVFNVISGNAVNGIYIEESSGTEIYANIIGLNYLGNTSIPNQNGIALAENAINNTIGASGEPEAANTISGNNASGIQCFGQANVIRRNRIGLDLTGTAEVGVQQSGVLFGGTSNDNVLGGNRSTDFNLISGNELYGVSMFGESDSISGNFFGVNTTTGTGFTTEQDIAVLIGSGASDNVIGGVPKNTKGNVILNQTEGGILFFFGENNDVVGNYIGLTDANVTGVMMDYGVKMDASAEDNNEVGLIADNGQNTISNNAVGVLIDGASNQFVRNNLIGTDTEGEAMISNTVGVRLENGAASNTIGGGVGAGNIISGNSENELVLTGPGTENNEVFGNSIGEGASGIFLGSRVGVRIENQANDNFIGDGTSEHANFISLQDTAGVLIDGLGTDDNKIYGNVIGNEDAPNFYGVLLRNGCQNNSVGGLSVGQGNLISGNDSTAIALFSVSFNYVDQNIVGLSASGDAVISNALGVHLLNSNGNSIGQSSAATGNTFTGNSYGGILIENSSDNVVYNNVIGLNPAGTAIVTGGFSSEFGIGIIGGSMNNKIGGAESNEHNTISNNGNHGLLINDSDENEIIGNNFGLSKDFASSFPNEVEGIKIENNSNGNVIGAEAGASPYNILTGHDVNLRIIDSDETEVINNFIGTDETGNSVLSGTESQEIGVLVESGSSNTKLDNNVISGHKGGWGVRIQGAGTNYTILKNNHVGIGLDGSTAVPNRFGVIMRNEALGTKVGLNGEGNVISANDSVAILVEGAGTDSTSILGNYIGLNSDGSGEHSTIFGVAVYSQPEFTFIGGEEDGEENYIVGTDSVAVYLLLNAQRTYVSGNVIGQNTSGADVSTGEVGVMIRNSDLNWIGGQGAEWGNSIGNCVTGIAITDGSQTNAIMSNELHNIENQAIDINDDDTALPIDGLTDPSGNNEEVDQPQIDIAFPCEVDGNTQLSLITTLPPVSGGQYRFEFFANEGVSGDAESFLEANTLLYNPTTVPDTITITDLPAELIGKELTVTATQTYSGGSFGNTTELSAGVLIESAPTITVEATDVSCDANSDGSIEVSVPGFVFTSELNAQGASSVTDDTLYTVALGDYDLEITFANGCLYNLPVTIDVSAIEGLEAIGDIEVCRGSLIQLDAFGGETYEWDADDDLEDTDIPNPEASPSSEKHFFVTITDENGCEVRDSVYVSFTDVSLCELEVYNVITPNGDGQNDSFHIEGIEGYDLVTVYIYNRWGDLIRKIEGYDNLTNAWDGTKRSGEVTQSGTYYYVVDVGDSPQSQAGYIQVLR